jgi:hypothetical protein
VLLGTRFEVDDGQHPHRPATGRRPVHLASELADLLTPREQYDAAQRSVARAATAYFLEVSNAVDDHQVGGLMDDIAVVHAAREALGGVRPPAGAGHRPRS